MKTIKEVKADNDYISSLKIYEYELLFVYKGGETVSYYMFKDGKLLFEGIDFKPSPLHNVDDLQSMLDCFGFLTLQPGDTDDTYFDNYTTTQLDWAKSHDCEQLAGMVRDIEDGAIDYTLENSKTV